MNDFLTKLSIYDQLGYLVVGGLLYVFLLYDQTYLSIDLSRISSSSFGLAIVVYFLGHTMQAFARRVRKPTRYEVEPSILGRIKAHFDIPTSTDKTEEDHQAFQVCYLYALAVDKTGHVEIMNARYGLYRGWVFVLVLQAFIFFGRFLYCLQSEPPEWLLLVGSLLCILLARFTDKRSAVFYQNIGEKTIHTFLINKPDKPIKPVTP